jgi:hypothetical protein
MALVLKDRVKETTTTTGTGSFSLAGAVTGYDSFGQIGTGNTTYYAVYLDGGSEWEVGIGTYTAPSTLSRDTILASSNSGSVVTFSAGQKTIWCDYPAGKAVYTDASGNVSRSIVDISAISGAIKTPESIEFDTNPSIIPTATGSMFWDNGNKTPSLVLDADVTLQVGQENVVLVYNNSASTITNGSVVAVNGAQGQRPAVVLADADTEPLSAGTLGIATEDIAAGAEGFVTTFGIIRGIDTSAFAAGNPIYLSTTAGQFTATRPPAPAHTVFLGWIIKVNASSGEVFVNISNGWELDELHNVLITSPTGGNLLSYDQTAGYWKNINLTDGTAISITEATNGAVTIANTGVTALSAGTGISVSGSTGNVTVTNTAPDQTVSLTGAGTTTVTGTYPNFTITSNDQYVGTVTSVSALTLGTTGTDLSSSVANSTTTPVITLNVPTASATNRGALSSTDWTTFNNKANAFTYTTNYIPYGQGTTTPTQSANLTYDGTTLKAQAVNATNGIVINKQTVSANYTIASGDSGMSAGPVTVASGVTVTVSSGSRWVVL